MADEVEAEEQAKPAPEEPAPEGLLADMDASDEDGKTPAEEPDHIDKAASGEKPEWLPDKFWDDDAGPDYEALAKSQNELYKKLRSGKHLTPDEGEYDLKFIDERIPEDDDLLTRFKTIATDRGLTQDDFEQIVGMVLETMPEDKEAPEEKFDREAEVAKLGPKGEEILTGIEKWGEYLVEKDVWTDDDYKELQIWGGTAEGVRALTRLRQFYGEKTIPVHAVPDGDAALTDGELQSMMADPRYETDPGFRQKVYRMFERHYPSDDGVTPELT
jgi:hypothetical protein